MRFPGGVADGLYGKHRYPFGKSIRFPYYDYAHTSLGSIGEFVFLIVRTCLINIPNIPNVY